MHILELLYEGEIVEDGCEILDESSVVRQFRKIGGKLRRQFRCLAGDKAGKLVTSPDKCGIRRDPRKVRQGLRSARIKKQERIRKAVFSKRKADSKNVQRLNKLLRGDFNEV